jgi:hypothetical protein
MEVDFLCESLHSFLTDYLDLDDIKHTKAYGHQTNGIGVRFYKKMKSEHNDIMFRWEFIPN